MNTGPSDHRWALFVLIHGRHVVAGFDDGASNQCNPTELLTACATGASPARLRWTTHTGAVRLWQRSAKRFITAESGVRLTLSWHEMLFVIS